MPTQEIKKSRDSTFSNSFKQHFLFFQISMPGRKFSLNISMFSIIIHKKKKKKARGASYFLHLNKSPDYFCAQHIVSIWISIGIRCLPWSWTQAAHCRSTAHPFAGYLPTTRCHKAFIQAFIVCCLLVTQSPRKELFHKKLLSPESCS